MYIVRCYDEGRVIRSFDAKNYREAMRIAAREERKGDCVTTIAPK